MPMKMFDRAFAEYLTRLSHREITLFLAAGIQGEEEEEEEEFDILHDTPTGMPSDICRML